MGNLALRGAHCTVLAVALSTLVACSSERNDFEIPEALCGTAVDDSVLSPLLPSSGKLEVRESNAHKFLDCRILVDGESVLEISMFRDRGGFDPVREGGEVYPLTNLKSAGSVESWSLAVADQGAAATVECARGDFTHLNFDMMAVGEVGGEEKPMRESIEKFVQEFLPLLRANEPCQA